MVARPQDPRASKRTPGPDLAVGVFGHWRAAVSRVARAAGSAPSRLAADVWLTSITGFVVRPGRVMAADDQRPSLLVSRTGYACLAAGAVVAAIVTFGGGLGAVAATTDAVWLVLWAAARFAVMRLASGEALRGRVPTLTVAWAGGLMPLILAATPLLNALAVVASAVLTWRALRAAGAGTRETTWVVGWAFGGQVAVEILAWIVRGGLIYGVLLGR